jgi:DNA-directed RNA polymerase III subunit RPC1
VAAKVARAHIDKTCLGQVSKSIKQIYSPQGCYILVELDIERIESLKFELNAEKIKRLILKNSKLKLKENHIHILDSSTLRVEAYDNSKHKMFFNL